MAHTVLRMYSYQPAMDALTALGYETVRMDGLLRQRRFASAEEQSQVLDTLADLGVDPRVRRPMAGCTPQLFISRPRAAAR